MPELSDAPCAAWDIDLSVCPTMKELGDPELVAKATLWATTYLWRRARQAGLSIGVCDREVFVTVDSCQCFPCLCGPRALIRLSDAAPVVEIDTIAVMDSGTAVGLDPDRFAIVDSLYVGLVDASCGWTTSMCSTLRIRFSAGYTPDEEALDACALLAEERYKGYLGLDCRLPLKTNALSGYRRGRNGRRDVILTGLPLVDQWLLSLPTGPSGMYDPTTDAVYVKG